MSRSYKHVRLKKDRVYSVEQLQTEYSVTANTVSNWVGEGLSLSDTKRPHLFRGQAVEAFHLHRRSQTHRKLLPGQFQCWVCQSNVFPDINTVEDLYAANGRHMFSAQCPACLQRLQKISGETDRDVIEDCRNPNTPMACLHEVEGLNYGDIGISEDNAEPVLHSANDRIIFRWQMYAGQYTEKTIVRHLAAIRYFESYLEGIPFSKLSTADFASFRDDLKRRADVSASDSLSASSIRHTVSHLVAFFDWLLKQEGYRRLPKDFAGYLKLPKAVVAKSAQVNPKAFPTLAKAEELLTAMPAKSLIDQRAQAIFALAFLGALRADTLVSLQVKHIDTERRMIFQDASVVRAKAGKSLNIFWFQIPIAFEAVLLSWLETLHRLGFKGDDALFPGDKHLKQRVFVSDRSSRPVPVMTTTHAVSSAFLVACLNSDIKYTPHSAKHTIGAERDIRALTHEERKAWSLNMGHDSEQITEQHYGTMSDDRRFDVLENIGNKKTIDLGNMSEADKAKAFDAMLKTFRANG